jgi:tRNA(adenine34) deaminase
VGCPTDPAADARWMRVALEQARAAADAGEVPVGAVLVVNGEEMARGRNRTIGDCDPTAHAEVVTLRDAGRRLGAPRLGGTLYVTLEPCVLCMGALIQARVERLVYAATDPKAGACGSLFDLSADGRLNHRFAFDRGLLAEEAGALLVEFFRARRGARR